MVSLGRRSDCVVSRRLSHLEYLQTTFEIIIIFEFTLKTSLLLELISIKCLSQRQIMKKISATSKLLSPLLIYKNSFLLLPSPISLNLFQQSLLMVCEFYFRGAYRYVDGMCTLPSSEPTELQSDEG